MHPLYAVRVRLWGLGGAVISEVNYIHTEVTVRVAAMWAAVHCDRIGCKAPAPLISEFHLGSAAQKCTQQVQPP